MQHFDGLSDGATLTNQYAGLTFSNAIVLTAGVSLNEFEFPPHSGTNVVSDNGGPMFISFSTPVESFSGYFTYAEPLTIDAFGAANNLLTSVTSAFSNNETLSVFGSSPNELLKLSSASGISLVAITGDPAGESFTLDDATYGTTSPTVPEPSSLSLCLVGLGVVLLVLCGDRRYRDRAGRF